MPKPKAKDLLVVEFRKQGNFVLFKAGEKGSNIHELLQELTNKHAGFITSLKGNSEELQKLHEIFIDYNNLLINLHDSFSTEKSASAAVKSAKKRNQIVIVLVTAIVSFLGLLSNTALRDSLFSWLGLK
ncbi:hypothetical protein QUF73_02625 [Cytobacillus sp. NJ13]|nr:hypothetical protein [Cytobacillus sp. NJ13]